MPKKEFIHLEDLIEDHTFIQWAKGENSPQSQEWEYHYQNNPKDREAMEQARLLIEGVPFNRRFIPENKIDEAWRKVENALEELPDEQSSSSRFSIGIYGKIAAAVALILIAGAGLYFIYQNQEVVYHTAYGQRTELTLPDGSHVTMNANSTLSYVRKNPRKVRMMGEMYFEIAKKPETGAPFFVTTPDLDIQVLGTEFNVNSRQSKTEVLLDEGSIVLDLKQQGRMLMKPGDLVSFSASENKILEQQTADKPEVITSWKEGVLLLDSISLENTLFLLEQTYGVKTLVQNKNLKDKILVGGVPNDDLETCVKALRTIYNLDIQLVTDIIIVK